MTPSQEPDATLADLLADYHRRRAAGEDVTGFAARLGAERDEFLAVVAAEEALDRAIAEPRPTALPHPFGPYTLVREVGRGGAGVVYEAVDRTLGRRVALKVLRAGFEHDEQGRARFQREASGCSRVRHDNIVPIFDYGEYEGQPYYTMDLVPGQPLSDLVGTAVLADPRSLCEHLAPVADALQALHEAGVIHRDVKPQNLLRRPDGRLVLVDFGLARTTGDPTLTRTGQAVGTPLYMSPEQLLGRQDRVDARSDVYGLGAVLYEALTGRPPFRTGEWPALIHMITTQRPEAPRALVPSLPAAVERIALKALEKEPDDRYASMAALAADLRAFAADRTVVGRPVTSGMRALRWARRRALPLLAAVTALGVGGWWWSHRPARFVLREVLPPDAAVLVDGAPRGPAPLDLALAPGEHLLALEREHFHPLPRPLTLAAGEFRSLDALLLTPRDAAGRDVLARAMNLSLPADETPTPASHLRSAEALPGVTLLAPRGRVRPEDLDAWWVEIPREGGYVRGGRLALRRGTEILWEQGLVVAAAGPSEVPQAGGALPEALRRAVRPGDRLTLAWIPPPDSGVATVTTDVDVVGGLEAGSDAAALRRLESRAAAGGRDGAFALLEIEPLRRAGLLSSALLRARAAAAADPTDRRAWFAAHGLLRALGLSESDLGYALEAWFRDASQPRPRLGPPPAP